MKEIHLAVAKLVKPPRMCAGCGRPIEDGRAANATKCLDCASERRMTGSRRHGGFHRSAAPGAQPA